MGERIKKNFWTVPKVPAFRRNLPLPLLMDAFSVRETEGDVIVEIRSFGTAHAITVISQWVALADAAGTDMGNIFKGPGVIALRLRRCG